MTQHELQMEGVDLARGNARLAEMGIAPAHRNEQERIDTAKANLAGPNITPARTTGETFCGVCHKTATVTGRNRLSDCGHMRRSGGTFVARDKKPTPAQEPPAGCISKQQARELSELFESHMVATSQAQIYSQRERDAAHALKAFIDSITAD